MKYLEIMFRRLSGYTECLPSKISQGVSLHISPLKSLVLNQMTLPFEAPGKKKCPHGCRVHSVILG